MARRISRHVLLRQQGSTAYNCNPSVISKKVLTEDAADAKHFRKK
jgi:hypothetical protein